MGLSPRNATGIKNPEGKNAQQIQTRGSMVGTDCEKRQFVDRDLVDHHGA